MWDILFYLLLVIALAVAIIVGGVFVRGYLTGTSPAAVFFRPRPEKRLEIMEQSSLDGRRRLVLIRRDDVEHLIMTGGPVDVVIETGIASRQREPVEQAERAEPIEPSMPVFSRAPRTLGQAVGES